MTRRFGRQPEQTAGGTLRRHRADFLMVLFMSILMLLGLIVIYSISPALTAQINATGNTLDQNHFMYRQLVYLLAGVIAFVLTSIVPLAWWNKYRGKLLVGALGLCMVPITFARTSLALCSDGGCRWINFGFVTLQPVEAVKLALVLFLAGFLAKRIQEKKVNSVSETLWPVAVVLGVIGIVVIVLQRDLGTGITIFGITISMLYVSGLRTKYFLGALGVLLVGSLLFIGTSTYRLERVTTFFSGGSAADPLGSGYHITQALIAVGTGGLIGQGIGQSVQAFGYLPEAANDSIFAIVAEKFGFIGTVAILLIFAALLLRLIKNMDSAGTVYHKLIMAGIFGWVFTHTVVNIGAMLGIFPLTGVTLPFLSFGGTSLLFIMMALGIAFQISRYTTHQLKPTDQEGGAAPYENRRSRRGVGRTRYAYPGRY